MVLGTHAREEAGAEPVLMMRWFFPSVLWRLRTVENIGRGCELARQEAWQEVQGLKASNEQSAPCRAVGRDS